MSADLEKIVTAKDGEELLDLKLLLRATENVSKDGVACQVAGALTARRNGELRTETSSPERVKSVRVADFIPGLA